MKSVQLQNNKKLITEIKRKCFHLLALFPLFLYTFFNKNEMSFVFGVLLTIALTFDILRLKTNFHTLLKKFHVDILLREHEKGRLSAFSYTMFAMLICVTLASKAIFFLAVSIMVFADIAAAFIGMVFGKKRFNGKSIAGSVAFFITAILVSISITMCFQENMSFFMLTFIASFFATLAEFFSKNVAINDNLAILFVVTLIMKL